MQDTVYYYRDIVSCNRSIHRKRKAILRIFHELTGKQTPTKEKCFSKVALCNITKKMDNITSEFFPVNCVKVFITAVLYKTCEYLFLIHTNSITTAYLLSENLYVDVSLIDICIGSKN